MKKLLLISAFLLASILPLGAVTTAKFALTNAAWTDLGAGPLLLSFRGSSGVYAISDATPSLTSEGFTMIAGDSAPIKTTSHVWATSKDALGVTAYVAPISP